MCGSIRLCGKLTCRNFLKTHKLISQIINNQDFFKIESYYSKSNEKNQISNSENFSTYDLRTKTLGLDFKPYLTFDKKSQASFYLIFGLNYNKFF